MWHVADNLIIFFYFNSVFKELMFKLPNDSGLKSGERPADLAKEPLRFAVHPAMDGPVIAMATISYGDLKILVRVFLLCHVSF